MDSYFFVVCRNGLHVLSDLVRSLFFLPTSDRGKLLDVMVRSGKRENGDEMERMPVEIE